MKKFFAVTEYSKRVDLSLFLLRIVMGYAFMIHGWGKIQSPFNWAGPDSSIPAVFLFLAAVSEFCGGAALILGLFHRLAALGLLFTMGVAVGMHRFVMGDPFVSSGAGGSYELAAVYFFVSLLFFFTGPGRYSLDYKLFGKN